MLRIPFEWFEFPFECFESLSNGSNFHSNASNLHSDTKNPFWIVRICIQMNGISFEGFEFGLECFESLLNGFNLDSNATNPFRMVRIWIWIIWISLEGFELGVECFESLSNGLNLDSNASNPVGIGTGAVASTVVALAELPVGPIAVGAGIGLGLVGGFLVSHMHKSERDEITKKVQECESELIDSSKVFESCEEVLLKSKLNKNWKECKGLWVSWNNFYRQEFEKDYKQLNKGNYQQFVSLTHAFCYLYIALVDHALKLLLHQEVAACNYSYRKQHVCTSKV